MPDLHEYKNKAIKVRPLLKWAGGKRQIVRHLISKLPEKFSVYYEPFFGAGALFLELYNRGLLKKAVISDLNKELIALYTLVRDRCSGIIEELENIRFTNNKDDYYRARDLFNSMESDHNPEKAALMIYLNRHAYNGLYRVNSSGKFNVPFGRYAHPSLPTPDDIISFSKALSNVKIINKDFETAVSDATVSDFVYFDPPYAPLSRSSDFSAYSSLGFSLDEQKRLSRVFEELSSRGVMVMESNSATPFIKDLYRNYPQSTVQASRNINSKSNGRGKISELIITNYH